MSNNVIVEVTVVPLGTGSTSLSNYVVGIEKVLEKFTSIKKMLTPMSTILEGEMEEVLAAVRQMHEAPFLTGVKRVITRIDIDDRRDKLTSMERKVETVNERL